MFGLIPYILLLEDVAYVFRSRMVAERCPTCGGAVKVVGNTTLHYKPVEGQETARLIGGWKACERERLELGRLLEKAQEHEQIALSNARQVQEVLRTLHMAVLNVRGNALHDLYQDSDLRNLVEKALEE